MSSRLSRRSLPAAALAVAAAVLATAALAPRRAPLAAAAPATLPRQAENLHPVAALPEYRAPVRPRRKPSPPRLERRVTVAATPAPQPAITPTPTPTATPEPAPVAPRANAAPPRAVPTPARTFDSSGSFDSS
jgi:hypothetical protein